MRGSNVNIEKPKNSDRIKQIQMLAIVGIVAVVALIAVVIFQSSTAGGAAGNYGDVAQERTEDGAFILGNPEAPITIVLFEDFLCPHCQNYQPQVKTFINDYVFTGKARVEFRMVVAVDPTYSTLAFQLAECSNELKPNSFWEAHDTLFSLASTRRFNEQVARDFATRMEIPYTDLLTCTGTASQFQADNVVAQAAGVRGTPTVGYRINGGEIQFQPLPQQPTAEDLALLVEAYSAAQ
jgi:protein-disulfide isomerase